MNRMIEEKWPWIEGSHGMRVAILDTLSDADLTFSPGGANMTLGELCREMGEVEHSYVQSLKVFKQDWLYKNTEAGLDRSVQHLKAWFQTLDDDLKATISALSDEDVRKSIDRNGYPMSVPLQLDVYLQALLIFFGKATIFLKAMNKPLPPSVQEWVW
jgi:uncharacterized damage-inducible protein DinB